MFKFLRQAFPSLPFAGKIERSRLLSCIQLLIALTFLVAVGAVVLTMVRYARANAAKELVERGAITTSIVARAAARAAEEASDKDAEFALDRVIYDIRAEQGLEFAFIIDGRGVAVAHSNILQKGKPASLGAAFSAAESQGGTQDGFCYTVLPAALCSQVIVGGDTVYQFVRPIDLSLPARERYAGTLELHMGFSLPGFWPFALSSLKRGAPGLAIAFILLALGNYLAGVFVRPLSALREETAARATADTDWELEVEANGEIAEIAQNWNRMVENFRTSYQRVVEARRQVEVHNRVMLYEKKQTEAILDGLNDGVMVLDPQGRVSFVNRECENLLSIERSAVAGKLPVDIVKEPALREFLAAEEDSEQEAARRNRKSRRRAADVELSRNNTTRHLRLTRVPVADGSGKPSGSIITLRDSTQETLEERARREFISSVAHELRAPLTAIKSYVEMLIDDEARSPELQRDFFNTINEEADRLARLINDMLSMSKIEVGNLVLNKSIVRTRKLMEDAVNGLRSAAKSKSIELSANIPEDLPDIEADKELLRVVVTNLLGNGVKYTPDGGKVCLSAEVLETPREGRGERTIAVSVEDTGPGIAEDELDKVFEKFYRGRNTAGLKVPGNGLGLAIAKEIATLHGGDIKVTSTVGQGSRFTFLLPAVEPDRKVS